MGLLTDFYVAPRTQARAILDDPEKGGFPCEQLKGIDPVKLESLGACLAKQLGRTASKDEALLLSDEDAEDSVFLVPPDIVALLADIGDGSAAAGAAWAQTEELKLDRWTAQLAADTIARLGKLATQARAHSVDLLLRISL
jgi:hypothetical protein